MLEKIRLAERITTQGRLPLKNTEELKVVGEKAGKMKRQLNESHTKMSPRTKLPFTIK